MVVLDASVLISLAKIRHLEVLHQTYSDMVVGPVVYEEVVTAGRKAGAAGVDRVEHALEKGWLRLERITEDERLLAARLLKATHLHAGEAEALAIAKERRAIVIIDDKEALSMADTLGVDYVGTAGMLLEAFFCRHLTLEGLENAVVELARVTWLSPGVVAQVLRTARENQV